MRNISKLGLKNMKKRILTFFQKKTSLSKQNNGNYRYI